jgi:hypothetical protein
MDMSGSFQITVIDAAFTKKVYFIACSSKKLQVGTKPPKIDQVPSSRATRIQLLFHVLHVSRESIQVVERDCVFRATVKPFA